MHRDLVVGNRFIHDKFLRINKDRQKRQLEEIKSTNYYHISDPIETKQQHLKWRTVFEGGKKARLIKDRND